MSAELAQAMKVQIHGQKGHIRRHITISESGVKFNAVEDIYTVRQADVAHVEVAVAVPDALFFEAPSQQQPLVRQEAPGKVANFLEKLPGEDFPHQGLHAGKIFFMVIDNDPGFPVSVNVRVGCGLLVKRDQHVNQPVHKLLSQLPPVCHFIHHALLGEPHHFQKIFHRMPPASYLHP
jgi:hypothetical protein